MNKYNRYHLLVLSEIKEDPYFYKENNAVIYRIPQSNDGMNKVTAVRDLIDFGAFKLLNQERFSLDFEFSLIINHSSFSAIHERCAQEVDRKSVVDYEHQVQNRRDNVILRKMIKEIIKMRKVGKTQKLLLISLANFNTKAISDLIIETKSKDLKSLVHDTNEKLRGSGFFVKSVRSNTNRKGFYILIYSPPSQKI